MLIGYGQSLKYCEPDYITTISKPVYLFISCWYAWHNSIHCEMLLDIHCNGHYHCNSILLSYLVAKMYSFNVEEIKSPFKLAWIFPVSKSYLSPFCFDNFLNCFFFPHKWNHNGTWEKKKYKNDYCWLSSSFLLPYLLTACAWMNSLLAHAGQLPCCTFASIVIRQDTAFLGLSFS